MSKLTCEQKRIIDRENGVFVQACPGAGKTETLVHRIARIAESLPPRRGIAVLSFTNTAIEEFVSRCYKHGIADVLKYPGFIDTFDSFIIRVLFAPGGFAGLHYRPTVVKSWRALGVEIRLRGERAFRGKRGIELDRFDPETNEIDLESITYPGLQRHVRENLDAYKSTASSIRKSLYGRGYLSVKDVRLQVVRRLEDRKWSSAMGRILSTRFQEVIVDEAQDCNSLDCRIILWLLENDVKVTVVADPDQAIYEFRHGSPAELRVIASQYSEADRLSLTGNFRSSQLICNVASSLRSRPDPDRALGETAQIQEPVHLISYHGRSVPQSVGVKFRALLATCGIDRSNAIVLAHSRNNALRACGLRGEEDVGSSKVAVVARAVADYHSPVSSGKTRETALESIERVILGLMGKIEEWETPSRAAERHAIDKRWLRHCAVKLVSGLPPSCEDTNEARTRWILQLREAVERLDLEYAPRTTVGRYFQVRQASNWHRALFLDPQNELRTATVHEAKGKAYDAVCLVVPPDSGGRQRTTELLNMWESRTDDEAKRVVYVGVTRARRLLALAVPSRHLDRVVSILQPSVGNQFEIHET